MAKGSSPSNRAEVSAILAELVSHFDQAVHKLEENPPYFDSVQGLALAESPVSRFCLDRLASLPSNARIEWIIGYKEAVHQHLGTPRNNTLAVLQNYEWILAKLLDRGQTAELNEPTSINEIREQLSMTIALVSSDLLFVFKDSLSFSDYIRGNFLIPTLVRIQHHIICALLLSRENAAAHNPRYFIPLCVSLLPFSRTRLYPPSIDPYLVDVAEGNSFQSLCIVPPKIPEHCFGFNDFISLKAVSWKDTCLNGSTLFTEIGCRAAGQAWKSLADLLRTSHGLGYLQRENDANDETDYVVENHSKVVLRSLGIVQVAQFVQSRFLHHDFEQMPDTVPETQIFLGRRRIKKPKPLEEMADPSMIHVLLAFVRLLGREDCTHTPQLVPLLIPCCLKLIDSTSGTLVALGSSALAYLLRVLDRKDTTWRNFHDDIRSKLEDASKVHRKGPAVFAIGQAQCLVLQLPRTEGRMQTSFCKQWLMSLHQVATRSMSDSSWEILVGGVAPLLYEMTKCSDVPGLEIGRLGLSALLPLVASKFVDIKTQVAAAVALINLMVAAYPIMPYHGEKIICHLLASLWGPRGGDEKDVQRFHEIMLHAAAVCLVVSGPGGYKVLDVIEYERKKYQKPFLEVVSEVRNLAITLSKSEMEETHVF